MSGGTPSTDNDEYWGGDIQWLTPSEITSSSHPVVWETDRTLTEIGLENSSANLVPPYSVLLTSRATVGETVMNGTSMATNQGFQNLVPTDMQPWFLYYAISYRRRFLESVAVGGTFDEISKSEVQKIRVPVPTSEEQEQIASILYTVDELIDTIQQLIDKHASVRTGLIQTLVTGSSYSEVESHDDMIFQELPQSWDLVDLTEVSEVNPRCEIPDEDVPYIPMDAIDTTLPAPQYVEQRNPKENSGTMFGEGDTLFASITPCTENGKIAHIKSLDHDVGIATTEVKVISPDENLVSSEYLYYVLNSPRVRSYAVSRMRGSTGRQRVPSSVFKNELSIPLPSMEEQEEISDILSNKDETIASLQQRKEKLIQTKEGMMEDLFSGDAQTTEGMKIRPEVLESDG